jgi:hypothetical protein
VAPAISAIVNALVRPICAPASASTCTVMFGRRALPARWAQRVPGDVRRAHAAAQRGIADDLPQQRRLFPVQDGLPRDPVEVLLADPESLGNDALEGDLYIPTAELGTATSPTERSRHSARSHAVRGEREVPRKPHAARLSERPDRKRRQCRRSKQGRLAGSWPSGASVACGKRSDRIS